MKQIFVSTCFIFKKMNQEEEKRQKKRGITKKNKMKEKKSRDRKKKQKERANGAYLLIFSFTFSDFFSFTRYTPVEVKTDDLSQVPLSYFDSYSV